MIRLFSIFIPTSILGLLISEILFIAACYTLAIRWQLSDTFDIYMLYERGILRVTVVMATIVGGLYLSDCYERVRIRSRLIFLQQLCLIIGVAFLLQSVLSYGDIELRMPRQSMLLGSSLCLAVLVLWRSLYTRIVFSLLGAEKILLVGTHALQSVIAGHLRDHPEFGMKPIGFVREEGASEAIAPEEDILGNMSEVQEIVERVRPDRIVIGPSAPNTPQVQNILSLKQMGYRTESMSETFEMIFGRVPISQLHPIQVTFQQGFQPSPLLLTLQAAYSWLIALVGLIVVSPVLLVTALAVRLHSPGPILYRQVRTGRNNTRFTLYKFRSMSVDAEARTGAVWAQANDSRITPLGRILRKYRIDELPQMFNVLRGEMAIVGPRPERPEFVDELARHIPLYKQRLAVRPGITGWAQINYRYGNSIEDTVMKLEYDLYYIKNFSPQLDLYVMFHTVKTMLLARGAY